MLFSLNEYRYDLMPVGIVEEKKSSYVIIDKLFYKSIVFSDELIPGDILLFEERYSRNEMVSQIRKNILFKGDRYEKITHFKVRSFFRDKRDELPDEGRVIVDRMIYGIYPQEETSLDFGYGLSSYYLLSSIRKRSRSLCFALLLLYCLFFCFPIKFYLLLLDLFLDMFSLRKDERFAYKLIVVSAINVQLLQNPSFLLVFLFDLYRIFSLEIGFKTYLALLSGILFGEFDLFDMFFFSLSRSFKVFLLGTSVLSLLLPFLSPFLLYLGKGLTFLQKMDLPVRGRLPVLFVFLFLDLCRDPRFKEEWKKSLLLLIFVLLPLRDPLMQVDFIDVGQGDAAMIKMPFLKSCILIDTGSPYNYGKLKKFLCKKGIYRIDLLIVTHDDSDHNGNVDALKKDFDVKETVLKGSDLQYHGIILKHLDTGNYDNDNDNSLVYYLDVEGDSFLFTGDISAAVERKLIDRYSLSSVDFLKASHHGSKTGSSEYFIANLLPQYAILSTSGQYGHPHKEVLDILNRYRVRIFSTAESSSVCVFPGRFFSFIATGKNEFVIIRS
ncbi:MAG: MBL fold metallo-hydrolase [Erysipelotrichaceae bacterium]|nr:MBL fold metallo-hydrolase [Erysipelotrichaceae bacterium]